MVVDGKNFVKYTLQRGTSFLLLRPSVYIWRGTGGRSI